MSRKANKPIPVPKDVTIAVANGVITVKGPKGELQQPMHSMVTVNVADDQVVLTVTDPTHHKQRAMWGTFGSLITNMIQGVTVGFTQKLEINGVGYGFDVSGKKLTIKAGFSHPVIIDIPEAIDITQDRNVITLVSRDKQLVGQVAAEIRKIRKPEPYKGKGIKYVDEIIIRKQGKQAAGSSS